MRGQRGNHLVDGRGVTKNGKSAATEREAVNSKKEKGEEKIRRISIKSK